MDASSSGGHGLLGPGDPAPVAVTREASASPFLIVCDHAGRKIPAALGDLGLPEHVRDRHIGWDIGAAAVAERLGVLLDATTVTQTYSRLVIDCNRPPEQVQSVVEVSDGITIPGNAGLTAQARAARLSGIHAPYHARIAQLLEARSSRGLPSVLISVHSFTPAMNGQARPWTFGVLHDGRSPLSTAMLRLLEREPAQTVGDNQPYRLEPAVDFTVPHHAQAGGLDYLEIEIRQDTISSDEGAEAAAALLAGLLPRAAGLTGES